MASKIADIFSKASARSRVFMIVGAVLGVVGIFVVASKFLGGPTKVAGNAKVAGAPSLQSVPGGQLTPEYYRALMQANAQSAQQAQVSGASAVPTLVNAPGTQQAAPAAPSGDCNLVCPNPETPDISNDINNLVKAGKLSSGDATQLLDMAKRNVPVSEYATYLNNLVKEGKLSPDAARKLLATYDKQHANATAEEGARTMDTLIKAGKLPLDVAANLLDMQKNNVTPTQYSDELNRLVREGKISPETAAILLAQYTQQQAKQAAEKGNAMLKAMAASGEITEDVANDLGQLQKRNVPVSEYQAELNRLVAAGKMTPAAAAKLLAQYQDQRTSAGPSGTLQGLINTAESDNAQDLSDLVGQGKRSQATADEVTALQTRHLTPQQYSAAIDQMVKDGKLPPDVAVKLKASADHLAALVSSGKISQDTANALQDLTNRKLSCPDYSAAIDQMVSAGKVSPDIAAQFKAQCGSNDINSLVAKGELTPEGAAELSQLQRSQVSSDDYNNAVDKLVHSGKLTHAAAAKLKADYARLVGLREEATKLTEMQANNASPAEFAAELKRAVAAGLISPDQAAALQREYEALSANVPVSQNPITPAAGNAPGLQTTVPGGESFAGLQNRLANQRLPAPVAARPGAVASGPDQAAQFAAAEAQAEAEAAKEQQQHIQDLMSQMTTQATALIASWQGPTMQAKMGNEGRTGATTTTTTTTRSGRASEGGSGNSSNDMPPLLKAGTILFAVLTTAVDSDYPDTPVMATIVSGVFKGATLLGKLSLAQGQNKVSLNFTIMNRDDWNKMKPVTAFAIDPDTARTVMASSVDNHYMLRYGTMFASSFVTGYANGISQSGSTTSSGIFGTTNTHPQLSPGEKIAVALGQVGTTFGAALANYVNTPATVKVNSGVGIGILFMADVSSSDSPSGGGGNGAGITQAPPLASGIK
jgi:polyhydroxyalkanoate synthesis regulator phasin